MIKKTLQMLAWYLWILPFIAFLIGYCACYLWVQKTDITIPNVIGKTILEGAVLLSQQQLSMRIRTQAEDVSLPEGTILDQFPEQNRIARPNQHIYVTISKKPVPAIIPDMCGMTQQQIQQICKKINIDVVFHFIPSHRSTGKCFAYCLQAGEQISSQKMVALIAAPQEELFLVPKLTGLPVAQVKQSLEQVNIVLEIFHEQTDVNHTCRDCVIVSQRPSAGTVVKGCERLVFQLRVAESS